MTNQLNLGRAYSLASSSYSNIDRVQVPGQFAADRGENTALLLL